MHLDKEIRAIFNGDEAPVLEDMVFLGYRGSIAHGTYSPSSDPNSIDDKDLMGVFIAPVEHYLGFGRRETFEKWEGEWDTVSYELRKYVRLLLKSNPTLLSMLWLEDEHILLATPAWRRLVENRHLFVSRQAYHSFVGYARSQMNKMKRLAKPKEAVEKELVLVGMRSSSAKDGRLKIPRSNTRITKRTASTTYEPTETPSKDRQDKWGRKEKPW